MNQQTDKPGWCFRWAEVYKAAAPEQVRTLTAPKHTCALLAFWALSHTRFLTLVPTWWSMLRILIRNLAASILKGAKTEEDSVLKLQREEKTRLFEPREWDQKWIIRAGKWLTSDPWNQEIWLLSCICWSNFYTFPSIRRSGGSVADGQPSQLNNQCLITSNASLSGMHN